MTVREGEWAAFLVLERVTAQGTYFNLALADVLGEQRLVGASRAMATALTKTVLENLIAIDFALTHFTNTKRCGRAVKNVLRIGAARLLYMETDDSAAVFAAVELCRKAGKAAQADFVNGVLRALAAKRDDIPWPKREDDEALYLGVRHSWPLFAVKQAIKMLGFQEADAMLGAKDVPFTVVRVNPRRANVKAVEAILRSLGGAVTPSPYDDLALRVSGVDDLPGQKAYRDGLLSLQGEASLLAVRQIPKDAKKVMDLCAAPGGKAMAMAERMPGACVVALDLHEHRVLLMIEQKQRLGLENVLCEAADATKPMDMHAQSADAVLLDAPCSGLGTAQNRPDVKMNRDFDEILSLSALQRSLLLAAAGYVKTGGTLVYSTCTFIRQENADNVAHFLSQHPDFVIVPLDLPDTIPGGGSGMVQLWPHTHETDGFFISRMRRIG
jgi:16S rRNA (cytosine967-C5)-methyltransferase